MKLTTIKWALSLAVILQACKKDDQIVNPDPIQPAKGVYVLSEGGFGANNAMLGYRNAATGAFAADFYLQQNPLLSSGLGDVANDALIYGGKMYIVMNGSGNVTVLNAATGSLLTKISFINGATNKSPRYAIGIRGKVFVSAFDNTVSVIDTTTFSITNTINVGSNPEGLASYGDYLYVANSGGLNYPNVDSTVSVINLNTLAEIKKITVAKGPNKIDINSAGKVFVSCFGVFPSANPSVGIINSSTNTLETMMPASYQFTHLRIYKDIAYFYNTYGSNNVTMYHTIADTLVRAGFINDGTAVQTVYGVNFDEQNDDVYITDAKDFVSTGEVTCFDRTGTKKFSFGVTPGINPNKVLFLR